MKLRKLLIIVCAFLFALVLVGCKKEENPEENNEPVVTTYTVTLNNEGASETITFTSEDAIPTLPTKTKEGADFLGWYDGETKVETLEYKDYTLTAKYQVYTYTVTFDSDGAGEIAAITFEYNKFESVTLTTPSKEGYTFLGWYEDGYKIDEIDENKNYNLKATYEQNKVYHSITLNAGDGTVYDPVYQYAEGDGCTLPEAQLEGYTFLGWYDGDTKVEAIGADATTDITLTAKWEKILVTYILNLCLNGGTLATEFQDSYTEGDSFALPTPTRDGATFDGWYDADGNKYEEIKADTIGDLTLDAKWIVDYIKLNGVVYATLDLAIAASKDGDVITIAATDEGDELDLNTAPTFEGTLTIQGPNAGVNAKSSERKAEAVVNIVREVFQPNVTNIVFDGLTLKGVGATSSGTYMYAANGITSLTINNCVVYNMNTVIKCKNEISTNFDVTMTGNYFYNIGQFIIWTNYNLKTLTFTDNYVDLSGCGGLGTEALNTALFRLRCGSGYFYHNTFTGTLLGNPFIFEISCAGELVVMYNTFDNTAASVFENNASVTQVKFESNLYLDESGAALAEANMKIKSTNNKVVAETVTIKSKEELEAAYAKKDQQ